MLSPGWQPKRRSAGATHQTEPLLAELFDFVFRSHHVADRVNNLRERRDISETRDSVFEANTGPLLSLVRRFSSCRDDSGAQ